MTMLGEGLKLQKLAPAHCILPLLQPVVSSVSLLRYVAARKTKVLGHPRRGAPTMRAYSGAGTSTDGYTVQYGILWQGCRELSSFRGRQSNSGRAHDGPILPQACIKLAFLLCYHRSFFPPCTLPCGPHLPPSLPWLLGCSVAFSIPRTPYMAP